MTGQTFAYVLIAVFGLAIWLNLIFEERRGIATEADSPYAREEAEETTV